ncbi:ABC transporter substrate-binding protein [Acetobacteraceae bacterium H6797]|nr:ABC transporter substrate-binding protein [Acetobacteraceae bacterium H6797]
MLRRQFLGASTALFAMPAIARAQGRNTLRFIPQADLAVLDPIWTTATVTTNHAHYVYETLYAVDSTLTPRPQMAEGHEVSEDGLLWRFRLREGLTFHDGTPVRAADVVASMNRWMKRDSFALLLAKVSEGWSAPDDRTVELRLSKPFPPMLTLLSKAEANVPVIMPERLAMTDANKAVTEVIGSGPYRFVPGEYSSGARAVYEKFGAYKPRSEANSWAAGSKAAFFDRVEWHIIPDPSTAASALMSGEVDWWEQPLPDLLPMLARNRNLSLQVADKLGKVAFMRMNHLQAPFNNPKVRQAVMLAIRQEDYMRTAIGDDTSLWSESFSCFPKGTPYYTENGKSLMPGDLKAAQAALKASGYAGEKVVIINPTDFPSIGALGQVTFDLLKRMGFNVDLQESDWGTVVQRRGNRGPVESGGWSIMHTTGNSSLNINPAVSLMVRGRGANGWFGWWESAEAEALVQRWLESTDPAEQLKLADQLSLLTMREVGSVPLGQFYIRTAFSKSLSGVQQGPSPFPWSVRRNA